MAVTADAAAWKRLGEQLVLRRVAIDARYANRTLFCAERGINYRLAYDMEEARRVNFTPAALALAASAYMLVPGSIGRTLAGGPLEPAPAAGPPRPSLAAVPPPPVLPDDPTDQQVAQFIIRQQDDELVLDLWRAWTFRPASREQRLEMVRELSRDPAEVLAEIEAEDRGEGHGGGRHREHREQALTGT